MVEKVDVGFCSDQSSDKADLGNEDGEAKEKGEAGSKDQQVSSHLKKIGKKWKHILCENSRQMQTD